MKDETSKVISKTAAVNDTALILKKMRELKGLTRKQAGIIFNLSYKTIEKLENGRGSVDENRLIAFADGYGFGVESLLKLKSGSLEKDLTIKDKPRKEKDLKRRDRRFCTQNITKECKVLRQLRESKGISQYELSRMCGYGERRIGFYECGRKNLDNKLIKEIIITMGYTMEDFDGQMQLDEMPYEIIKDCNKLMDNLDIKTLKAVRSFLRGFS